jgi:hypothetical protein
VPAPQALVGNVELEWVEALHRLRTSRHCSPPFAPPQASLRIVTDHQRNGHTQRTAESLRCDQPEERAATNDFSHLNPMKPRTLGAPRRDSEPATTARVRGIDIFGWAVEAVRRIKRVWRATVEEARYVRNRSSRAQR